VRYGIYLAGVASLSKSFSGWYLNPLESNLNTYPHGTHPVSYAIFSKHPDLTATIQT
jgi:hypothetical protein